MNFIHFHEKLRKKLLQFLQIITYINNIVTLINMN